MLENRYKVWEKSLNFAIQNVYDPWYIAGEVLKLVTEWLCMAAIYMYVYIHIYIQICTYTVGIYNNNGVLRKQIIY